MSKWINFYRETTPNKDVRQNALVIDTSTEYVIEEQSPLEAAISTVKKIVSTHPAPYTLLVSGGVDSQAMIWAWKLSGESFNVVHYFYNGTNLHDTDFLIQFCKQHQINFEIRNFDPIPFIQSDEYKLYAQKYDCSSPHILTYMKLVENHPETVVMSGNFIVPSSIGVNYTILGLSRYSDITKKNFIPFFFLETPELAYSFYDNYVKHKEEWFYKNAEIGDSYFIKCSCYLDAGFPILQQPSKTTGFEIIKERFDECKVPKRLKLMYAKKPSRRPFDLLYRYSLLDIIGDYSESTILVQNYK